MEPYEEGAHPVGAGMPLTIGLPASLDDRRSGAIWLSTLAPESSTLS